MPAVMRKMLAVRCATSSPTVYSYLESSFGLFAVAVRGGRGDPHAQNREHDLLGIHGSLR